jgi:hypothetical protein
MAKKIAAFYYTQTGQTIEILRSVCRPLADSGYELAYKEIVPEVKFPYPWTYSDFFQAFPESREAIACPMKTIDLTDVADADLVIIAYQPWFLSPSIPVHGFFQDSHIQAYLKGKTIITVVGCRNMWIKAQAKVKSYISQCEGNLVGNIVLQDRYPNLISVVTIIRWLIDGKKEKSGLFPAAGVSEEDIRNASIFGRLISEALNVSDFQALQEKLMQKGAIHYKPDMAFVEKAGHRIFGIWSKFVLKKGPYGSAERQTRLTFFKYYLFIVLYLVSPIGLLFFYLTYPFRYKSTQKDKFIQCHA